MPSATFGTRFSSFSLRRACCIKTPRQNGWAQTVITVSLPSRSPQLAALGSRLTDAESAPKRRINVDASVAIDFRARHTAPSPASPHWSLKALQFQADKTYVVE